jgi:hypothetical protein
MAPVDSQRVLPWRRISAGALIVASAAGLWRERPTGASLAPLAAGDRVETAAFFAPPEVPEGPIEARPLILARRPDVAISTVPPLVALPPVAAGSSLPSTSTPDASQPVLMSPQSMPADAFTEWREQPATDSPVTPEEESAKATAAASGDPASRTANYDEVDDSLLEPLGKAEADALLADASAVLTGSPTGVVVTEHAQDKIRRGFTLAQRGANFAARVEFIDVLRMIAEAKDQKHGASRRAIALANGLRALDEVDDFAPHRTDPEAAVSLAVILSSHRTPAAKEGDAEKLMRQQLADLYFRYAQLQLGASVAGEPAGSMALHALGKLYSSLGRVEPDKQPLADRKAFALQQAALLARDDNHYAAHELGVLLAESGHYAQSEYLLNQVALREPNATVYRNLARVERKLGRLGPAEASERQAQFLAARDPSGGGSVVWVTPDALGRTGDPLAPAATGAAVAAQPSPQQPRTAAAPVARQPVRDVTRLPGGYLR